MRTGPYQTTMLRFADCRTTRLFRSRACKRVRVELMNDRNKAVWRFWNSRVNLEDDRNRPGTHWTEHFAIPLFRGLETWHGKSRRMLNPIDPNSMHADLDTPTRNPSATDPSVELNQNAPALGLREESTLESLSAAARRAESAVTDALRRAEFRARETCERVKGEIRRKPTEAVLLAAAAGFFCNRLPVRSLCMAGLKIFSAFTPPTLAALGICKMAEYWSHRRAESSWRPAPEPIPGSDGGILMTDA